MFHLDRCLFGSLWIVLWGYYACISYIKIFSSSILHLLIPLYFQYSEPAIWIIWYSSSVHLSFFFLSFKSCYHNQFELKKYFSLTYVFANETNSFLILHLHLKSIFLKRTFNLKWRKQLDKTGNAVAFEILVPVGKPNISFWK